jgi:Leucine-rich repeat (LRR) protein
VVCSSFQAIPELIGLLTTLTSFSASHNVIKEVPKTFSSLTGLVELDLANNSIPVLCVEMFRCTNLETLILDRNQITELPPEFGDLRKLKTLSYEGNHVLIPPDEIRLKGLKAMLNFYDLIIMNAPGCTFKECACDHLGTDLILDNFGLKELPDVVYRGMPRPGGSWDDPPAKMRRDRWAYGMTHLTRLSLVDNQLHQLPDMIGRMEAIQELLLTRNSLQEIPATLSSMQSLKILDARSNRLSKLPASIATITTLEMLLLDKNQISSLPINLGYLPALRALECTNNQLKDLPIDLCQSTSLRILALDANPLRMPPNEIIERGMRAIFDFLGRLFRCQSTQTLDLRTLAMEVPPTSSHPLSKISCLRDAFLCSISM